MLSYEGVPAPLAHLIEQLSGLPGIGPKSAMRLGLNLLAKEPTQVQQLASALAELHQSMGFCEVCGCFSEHNHCLICNDHRRDHRVICVVEQPVDVLMLERSKTFSGVYHVLHGRLSPMDGVGESQLTFAALAMRLAQKDVAELILATSATVDGEATAHYISQRFHAVPGVNISRIARGVPEGGELEYVDEYTLARALSQRTRWQGSGTNVL
ncbi:MAG: recombination protein RecR [Zetaproteobacteria bacterium]|nr:recombination protein RecR [Zetaproteobacteria bacterium]